MPIEEPELKRMTGDPWTFKVPPICPTCGYNLTGLTSHRCPECGHTFLRQEVERKAREYTVELMRLRDVNEPPRYGLSVVVIGYILFGLAKAVALESIHAILGILLGVIGIGLGLSVLRARGWPETMAERLPAQPNYMLGLGVATLGFGLILLSIFVG